MTKKQLVSVVVPVFNEELNLKNFHKEFCAVTKKINTDFELIFVNDGSKDASMDVLKELQKKDSQIRIINLSRNFGSYEAIEAGMAASKGDAVAMISADLQDPPSIIAGFVEKWQKGAHIVFGLREERGDPFFKKLFAFCFNWLVRKFIIANFPVQGCDIGLFDRKIIDIYLSLHERNAIPAITFMSLGFKQEFVPYIRAERTAGESGWPFWKRVKYALDVLIGNSYFLIRAITAAGIFAAIAAIAYAVIIFFGKLFFGLGDAGWSSLAIFILLMGGINLIAIGIIAEYIWRMGADVKKFPRYIVMEQFEPEKQKKPTKAK